MTRQANDVVIAAFDRGNECATSSLHGVGAGFVGRFAGAHVPADVIVCQLGKMYDGGLDEECEVSARPDGHTGLHLVRSARELAQHRVRMSIVGWFAQQFIVDGHDRVGSDDDRVWWAFDGQVLFSRQAFHIRRGSFVRAWCFVDVSGAYFEFPIELFE